MNPLKALAQAGRGDFPHAPPVPEGIRTQFPCIQPASVRFAVCLGRGVIFMASILKAAYRKRRRNSWPQECEAEKTLKETLNGEQRGLLIDVIDHYIAYYDEFSWHCFKYAFRKGARTMMEL